MAAKHKHHDEQDDENAEAPRRTLSPVSCEMNVTPLIDVLLVLLIIFMAALPLTQKGLDVNLPLETKTAPQQQDPQAQVVANYTAEHTLSINKVPVSMTDLPDYLRQLFDGRTDKTLFIVGAPTVKYHEIMEIIDAGVGAGAKVALITEGMRREAAALR